VSSSRGQPGRGRGAAALVATPGDARSGSAARSRRRHLLLLPLLLILALTPPSAGAGGADLPALCLVCGERALTDALLNVAIFVPIGAAGALADVPLAAGLLVGPLLSAAVEAAQFFMPGAFPGLEMAAEADRVPIAALHASRSKSPAAHAQSAPVTCGAEIPGAP
jgi:hypothetical protein